MGNLAVASMSIEESQCFPEDLQTISRWIHDRRTLPQLDQEIHSKYVPLVGFFPLAIDHIYFPHQYQIKNLGLAFYPDDIFHWGRPSRRIIQ